MLARALVHGVAGVIPRFGRSPVADLYRQSYNRGGVSCRGEPAVNRVDLADVCFVARFTKEDRAELAGALQPLREGHGEAVFLCNEAGDELCIVAWGRNRPGLSSIGARELVHASLSRGDSPGNTSATPRTG